ncbi:LuxR C-terminal-related transcriptional regulator [Nocardia sp. NPDC056000]|uniref:helix-turn-helix transcriptional regulator n=1 Tax=Nocardia sp. NPDC056000 TaxID=3345674 RepID=UPI0035DBE244
MTVSHSRRPARRPGQSSTTGDGIPTLAFSAVPRRRQVAQLNDAIIDSDENVLLICSPVGTGKTVLLTQWVSQHSPRAFPGGVAWVTLTDGPHSTPTLWQRLRAEWDLPAPARGLLTTPLSEAADLADALTERDVPTLLVLDDAHLATDPVTLAGLEHFLLHAPACVRIVLSARFDPPIRWHLLELSSQLRRWSAQDLAFSAAEVQQLCREQDCALDESGVDALMDLTRGWAALVRIAAIYLSSRREEPAQALAALATLPRAVSDLLAGELISTLSPGLRLFLTYTSIPAEFTEELADSLIGGGTAQWMHELTCLNYPLTSVRRDGSTWFVFHPMLRAYFRAELNRLGTEIADELQLRTALYLQSIGEIAAALPHLLAVAREQPLRDFVNEHALALTVEGQGALLFDGLAAMDAGSLSDPFVRLLHVVDALSRTDLATARAYHDAFEQARPQASSLVHAETLTALTRAVDLELAMATGTFSGTVDTEIPTATGQSDVDFYLAVESATALLATGDVPEAERRLRAAIAVADQRAHPRLRLRARTRLALSAGLDGSLTAMRQRAEAALEFAHEQHLDDTAEAAHAAAIAGLGAYVQGEHSDIASPRSARWEQQHFDGSTGPLGGWLAHIVAVLTCADSTDDPSRDAETLRHEFGRLLDTHPATNSGGLIPFVVWRLLAVSQTYEAQLLVDQARTVYGDSPEVMVARAALEAAANRSRAVLDLVRPLLDPAAPTHPVHAVTAWLLHARAHHELGAVTHAREGMENALRRAAPEGIVRPFLDVGGALELLDAFAGSLAHQDGFAAFIRRHPLVHRRSRHPALTDTELKVLRHLPSARTTQQIADDLGVSINTVKTHLRGIYAKLGTNSRVKVMAVARRSGLL